MAAVELSYRATLYDLATKSSREVMLVGDASLTGLGVGGGPIQPPAGGGGSPGIPTFPIWGPPGISLPPGPGYPPVAGHPLPTPPEGPPDGGAPPTNPTTDKPPPATGGWGWVASWDDPNAPAAWGYFPGPGQPGPKG